MNLLLSYPRSGNSLTRLIIEYITRHTVIDETPNSPNSIIVQLEKEGKNSFKELNVNGINDKLILIKTHLFNTQSTIQRFKTNKLNLILRHYDKAISSHATKEAVHHTITEHWIDEQVKLYCDIIKFYETHESLYKFYYEDLINPNLQIKIIEELIEKNELKNISTYWESYTENSQKINEFCYNAYKNKMEHISLNAIGQKQGKKIELNLKNKIFNQLGKTLFDAYLERYV